VLFLRILKNFIAPNKTQGRVGWADCVPTYNESDDASGHLMF